MTYTHNWNQPFIKQTSGVRNLDLCIEVGCFEGLTSNYIADHLLSPTGKLICIDPLVDTYLSDNLTDADVVNNKTIYGYFNDQYTRFVANTQHQSRIQLCRDLSCNVYPTLVEQYAGQADLIYIDGDHRATAVYNDAVNCFELCKVGGLILFDDYDWGEQYNDQRPSVGIDKFLDEYRTNLIIQIKDGQVLVKKISNAEINKQPLTRWTDCGIISIAN